MTIRIFYLLIFSALFSTGALAQSQSDGMNEEEVQAADEAAGTMFIEIYGDAVPAYMTVGDAIDPSPVWPISRRWREAVAMLLPEGPIDGGLDPAARDREGRTLVVVTHSEDVALRAQRVVRLRDGRIESDDRRAP